MPGGVMESQEKKQGNKRPRLKAALAQQLQEG